LGAIDPEQSPYKEEMAASDITVIDLTKVKAGDRLHHSKFAESPEIVQLIGARLSSGQALTDSRLGLGDHIVAATADAAHTVGAAAGLVVSAPVAILDQNTRQNYAHHVETLGMSVSGGGAVEQPPTIAMPKSQGQRTAANRGRWGLPRRK
jgi:hypothetical protein